jgi:hypothetical protein
MNDISQIDNPITIRLGPEELVIRRRYEFASIANDFAIALWFLIGSIFFLDPSLQTDGVWLFVVGSFQFLLRPTLRLASLIHVQRLPSSRWEH